MSEMKKTEMKKKRLENNWTQQYVADSIGITKGAYSNIENGRRTPTLQVALKLQKFYSKPIEELLGISE